MREGKIIFYNLKSKFGFIKDNETDADYYFYEKNPQEKLAKDDNVMFELKQGKKGLEAINVNKLKLRIPPVG